jgi:hypothetical protein
MLNNRGRQNGIMRIKLWRYFLGTIAAGLLLTACKPGSESGAGGAGPGYDGTGSGMGAEPGRTNATNQTR